MSRFFINRPIFASVISIIIVIAGVVSLGGLPVAKFPEVSPPTVQVQTNYPGGNADVVAKTVATPIEQEVNGVENMLYMSSTSASDGSYTLNVTFELGVDMDMATVLVQNRVAIANPKLPEEVRRQGVTTRKQSTQILQFITLTAEEGKYDGLFLSNYALRIKDELSRIKGVGFVQVFGAGDYAMRIWLDPNKLKARGLTTEDVVNAIKEQNVQVAAGQVGGPPAPKGTAFQLTINTLGRLESEKEFADIIVKTGEGGRITRVKDVVVGDPLVYDSKEDGDEEGTAGAGSAPKLGQAKKGVELGAKDYTYDATFGTAALGATSKQCTTIAIYQLPGANALQVAQQIRDKLEELSKRSDWPEGLEYNVPFDTTKFVEASVEEVKETIFIAIALVVIVIFVFLQDWRATVVPVVAIPVSLVGTFAAMMALGFSINMLSLFGVVLAIGIVVDDAIVVVESTSTHIANGLKPREAAIKAMSEITGPVIATTLVLLAVFVPTAFMSGITGQLYRQFALTISAAVLISTVNALTLSPALCGIILRAPKEKSFFFFRWFNDFFDKTTGIYSAIIKRFVRVVSIVMLVFVGLIALTGYGFSSLPTGFVPTEDQGYVFVNVQLPEAASRERSIAVMKKLEEIYATTPGVREWVSISGYSLLSGNAGSNLGLTAVVFEDWGERKDPKESQEAIVAHLQREFAGIEEAIVFAFIPPPIDGLGSAGGFQMEVQDRGNVGYQQLQDAAETLVQDGRTQSGLASMNSTFRADTPQLFADVDRTQVQAKDVPLSSVFGTLQAFLGSAYVNDFNKFGRTYQVRLQADSEFRATADSIRGLEVRSNSGEMLKLGQFIDVRDDLGPAVIRRYNLYPSASVNGSAAPGYSSGQALQIMENMAETKLPTGMGYEWTGMAFQEKAAGGQGIIFLLAIVAVFLVLAAQYESWTSPAAVISVVPLAVLGVVIALVIRGAENNTYTQIGVVLLVALASKNAILIVEFASERRRAGEGIKEAAVSAARLRFRAILMTAFSSILGFLPLLVASGAGAASRQAVGNSVVGGMMAATVFSLTFVPTFFVVFQGLAEFGSRKTKGSTDSKLPDKEMIEKQPPPTSDSEALSETTEFESGEESTPDPESDTPEEESPPT